MAMPCLAVVVLLGDRCMSFTEKGRRRRGDGAGGTAGEQESSLIGAQVHHAVYLIILCMIAPLCLTIRCMQALMVLWMGGRCAGLGGRLFHSDGPLSS